MGPRHLSEMGMPFAFDLKKADFHGIRDIKPPENLALSNVFHKCFIDLDESGVEAAAATAVAGTVGGAAPKALPHRSFIANRSFIYFIQDPNSGLILFMGQLSQP